MSVLLIGGDPTMKRYQLGRRGSSKWTEPLTWTQARKTLRTRIEGKGPYCLKRRGEDDWGRKRGLPGTLTRLDAIVPKADVGDVFLVACTKPKQVHQVRVVEHVVVKVPAFPSVGHPNLKVVWTEVYTRWPNVTSWGVANCRKVSGSTRWSYHAPNPYAQAWDIHGSTATLDEVARYLAANRERLKIIELLWRVTNHYDHIHVAVEPRRNVYATPSCAR